MTTKREFINPPPMLYQFLEARAGAEFASLMLMLPLLRMSAPRGDDRPVMVLPGFMANDTSTWVLRRFLEEIGYAVTGWNMGRNTGAGQPLIERLIERAVTLHKGHGQKINLVGWSRGGSIAREIARARPDLVRQVITLGSPVKGGPSATSIGRLMQASTGMTEAQFHELIRQRERTPIRVPVTAIYSKTDGVVSWKASIDDTNPDVEHIEVQGSHVGLGVNPQVFRIVAERLHQPRKRD
jgi:triacylglycerol esterase/lipase EstA (alpha/beta hydrolase family)